MWSRPRFSDNKYWSLVLLKSSPVKLFGTSMLCDFEIVSGVPISRTRDSKTFVQRRQPMKITIIKFLLCWGGKSESLIAQCSAEPFLPTAQAVYCWG